MNYGHYQRSKPYMRVLRGYDPQETTTRAISAPVKDGQTIKSGQVIVQEWVTDEFQWVLADRDISAHLLQVPHFALRDDDDTDVAAAGRLPGLSCSGQFEIQTGYYVAVGVSSEPATVGACVTFGGTANAGSVQAVARGAGATLPVIGILSGAHHAGPIDLSGELSEASNCNVFQLNTHYDPRNASS